MSTFVILYPHYLLDGNKESLPTANASFPAENAVTGAWSNRFQTSATTTFMHFEVNLLTLPDEEKAPDYLYISGIYATTVRSASDLSIGLYGADDNTFGTTVDSAELTGINSGNLTGKNGDAILEAGALAPCDYWRARVANGGDSILFGCKKIMFGKWFDFGVEPSAPMRVQFRERDVGKRYYKRTVSCLWEGVSNNTLDSFIRKIALRSYMPLALYDREGVNRLQRLDVMPCKLISFDFERKKHDVNTVSCEFQEVF